MSIGLGHTWGLCKIKHSQTCRFIKSGTGVPHVVVVVVVVVVIVVAVVGDVVKPQTA